MVTKLKSSIIFFSLALLVGAVSANVCHAQKTGAPLRYADDVHSYSNPQAVRVNLGGSIQ